MATRFVRLMAFSSAVFLAVVMTAGPAAATYEPVSYRLWYLYPGPFCAAGSGGLADNAPNVAQISSKTYSLKGSSCQDPSPAGAGIIAAEPDLYYAYTTTICVPGPHVTNSSGSSVAYASGAVVTCGPNFYKTLAGWRITYGGVPRRDHGYSGNIYFSG